MYFGIVVRQDAMAHMASRDFGEFVDCGRLKRAFRGIYIDTEVALMSDSLVRRAALAYADRNVRSDASARAFLCCVSAAAEWSLPMARATETSVSVPRTRTVRRQSGMVVHRHTGADEVKELAGVRVVPRAVALVQAFIQLPVATGREMVIRSVQDGLVDVGEVLGHVPTNLPRRRELTELLDLAGHGSHSELEIAAVKKVLRQFGLAEVFTQQYDAVTVRGRAIEMDFAAIDYKIDLETDGSQYHSSAKARKRDNERDLQLRQIGWNVVRAVYEQVIDHPERVASALLSMLVERGWQGRPTTKKGRLALAALAR
jgi:hypothetical protein